MLGAGYNSSSSLVGFERRDMDLENILFWEATSESCRFVTVCVWQKFLEKFSFFLVSRVCQVCLYYACWDKKR